MKVFRKSTSVFVVVAILINSTYLISHALNEINTLTLTEYATELIDMIQLYDYSYESGSSESNDEVRTLNRLIVKTNNNTTLENDCGAVSKIEGYDCLHIMQYNSEQAASNAFEYYNTLSFVQYVEYDFNFSNDTSDEEIAEENTSKKHLSWGSSRVKADKAISSVESLGTFADRVVVAVLDTGLWNAHELFEGRFEESYVNLVDGSINTHDDNSHGTHVAGIIVDNSPSNVIVKPYKVLDYENEGSYLKTCTGIEIAIQDGVDVINLSLCGKHNTGSYQRYNEVVGLATEKNIPIVVASGNFNDDATNYCPANNEDVITVSATTILDSPQEKSNYGSCVDISAPGSSIYSSIPTNDYDYRTGTSMATPFVSAAVAILKSINPNLTPQETKNIIKNTASVPADWDIKYGVGILDMENMISNVTATKPAIALNSNNKAVISSASGGIIYYTTDGSTPVIGESPIYDTPIDIDGISAVRAIVYENGKVPSETATLAINWEIDLTIRYKGRKSLESFLDEEIESCHVVDEDIVEYLGDGRIQTHAIGKTKVIAFLSNNRRATFNITVKFADWQWIHKVFYEWFGILIWSF